MFLELGTVAQPYDSSTQEDQMFKASLDSEKREKIKNMEEKRRDVEGTGFYFVFVPPISFIHSHMWEQAILSGCGLFIMVSSGSIHLPANVRMSLFFMTARMSRISHEPPPVIKKFSGFWHTAQNAS